MFRRSAILALLTVPFLFPVIAFAGGGLISYEVIVSNGQQNFNVSPGSQFVVRPQVHLNNTDSYDPTIRWCQNCQIKVKLENPQSSDYIAQSSDTTDSEGTIYAKVISNVPGVRYAYAEVTLPDGTVYTGSKTSLNYAPTYIYGAEPAANPSPTALPSPYLAPSPKLSVKPSPKITLPLPVGSPEVSPSANLDQKVASLEAQLQESKKKQSALEEKIIQLTNFLKSIFPFFK